MSIGEFDVDALLIDAVPEMATVVRENRERWPETGMLYGVVSQLFDLVVEAARRADADARDLVRRAFCTDRTDVGRRNAVGLRLLLDPDARTVIV